MLSSGLFLAMQLSELQLALWYAGLGLEAYLVGLIVWRRLFKTFPIFSAYVCFVLVKSAGLLLVRDSPGLYYTGYWMGEIIAVVLALLVVSELYTCTFEAYPALRSFTGSVLLAVLALLVSSSMILTRLDQDWVQGSLLLLERSVRFIQMGLLVFFFFVAYYLRLPLDSRVRAVGIGFSVYVTGELVNYALIVYFRYGYEKAWSLLSATAYFITLAIWSIYLTASAPAPARAAPAPPVPALVELEAALRKGMQEINRVLWGVLRGGQA